MRERYSQLPAIRSSPGQWNRSRFVFYLPYRAYLPGIWCQIYGTSFCKDICPVWFWRRRCCYPCWKWALSVNFTLPRIFLNTYPDYQYPWSDPDQLCILPSLFLWPSWLGIKDGLEITLLFIRPTSIKLTDRSDSSHQACQVSKWFADIYLREVRQIIASGRTDRKSDPPDKPCPTIALEGYFYECQHLR